MRQAEVYPSKSSKSLKQTQLVLGRIQYVPHVPIVSQLCFYKLVIYKPLEIFKLLNHIKLKETMFTLPFITNSSMLGEKRIVSFLHHNALYK